jgi:bla regulator protein BlaR1
VINDTFAVVSTMMLAGSLAIAFVLVARGFLRSHFGAHIAYASWIAVPLAVIATLLPAPQRPIAAVLHESHSVIGIADIPLASVPIDWRPLLMMVWFAGIVATAVVFAVQQRRFLRSLGRLHVVDEGVMRADSVDAGPALVGAWRPLIVLPADFDTRYAPVERDLVLAHEHLHRERGDARINAIVALVRCLNWFNPVFHYAAARFRFDQELSCDAAVITRFPEARRSYAGAMLKTQLAGQLQAELQLPVGCRWPSGHPLKERILMLKMPLPTPRRRAFGLMVVVLCGVGSAYGAWTTQSSPPASLIVAPGAQIDAQFDVTYRGRKEHFGHTVSASGQSFAIVDAVGDDAAPWRAEFSGRWIGVDRVEVTGQVERDHEIVSKPLVVLEVGAPGTLEIGQPGNPDSLYVRGVFTVQNDHAGPEATTEAALPGDQVGDYASAQENTSYRQSFPPHYPQAAVDAHQSGHVEIKVLVDEYGNPRSAEVANANPPEVASVFGPESVKTVMQWRFHPARKEGKPVSGYILVPIDFWLDG